MAVLFIGSDDFFNYQLTIKPKMLNGLIDEYENYANSSFDCIHYLASS